MTSSNYSRFTVTFYTLVTGIMGAGLAYWFSFPFFIITGPAILITALSLSGLHFELSNLLRDGAFLFIGIAIGAGINADASAAILRWPVAFLVLAAMLLAILLVCRAILSRHFGYDRRGAILAASPGHLSYVVSLGTALDVNVGQIAVVQSVRLLALTLLVPLVAIILGIEVGSSILPNAASMTPFHLLVLLCLSILLGLFLQYLNAPAALLLGGLIVSSISHLADVTPGRLPPFVALASLLVLGTLIGTRFSGLTFGLVRQALLAGLTTTLIAATFAAIAALPVAYFIQMPLAHVLVAFSPGGLETMIAMGVLIDANPGFVAACHVGRLLILSVLIPALLGRNARSPV